MTIIIIILFLEAREKVPNSSSFAIEMPDDPAKAVASKLLKTTPRPLKKVDTNGNLFNSTLTPKNSAKISHDKSKEEIKPILHNGMFCQYQQFILAKFLNDQ